jgi:hypothetical protein
MSDIVHCMRYIRYTRRFRSWLYSRLQVIFSHDTDILTTITTTTTTTSDNDWDRSRDLLHAKLVREPLNRRGGPSRVMDPRSDADRCH